MAPAICLSFSAHASDWWMVWVTHEMLCEGTRVDPAVAFPDTSHIFCRTVTNTLTSYAWSSLFSVYLWRTSWSKLGETECMLGSPVTSDLCLGLGCCQGQSQAHRSTSCCCFLLFSVSQSTGLNFFSRLISSPDALLCPCQTRQASLGDPKVGIPRCVVRDRNSGVYMF